MADSIYLLKNCDVCGITFYKNELIKQGGLWVCRADYNEPPPDKRPLGGEGGATGVDFRQNASGYYSTTEGVSITKYTVSDSSNVPIDTSVPYTILTGSVTTVTYDVRN
jgi:hypothetical protein